MNFLVDYAGSSSDSGDESSNEQQMETKNVLPTPRLPKPGFSSTSTTTAVTNSVFSNRFVEEENAKTALLEKHVKMVPTKDQTLSINGKKICWNYRKGRCRFGHNCKYAHDSDIQKTDGEIEDEKKSILNKSVVCEQMVSYNLCNVDKNNEKQESDDWGEDKKEKKLKRPGLSLGIIPNKKVLKMYKDLREKDKKK